MTVAAPAPSVHATHPWISATSAAAATAAPVASQFIAPANARSPRPPSVVAADASARTTSQAVV
jgi:hypothetical protein